MRRPALAALAALASLLGSRSAFAHAVVEGVSGFSGGLVHPLLVPAHVLALIALGLLLGAQGAFAARRLFGVFVLSLAVAVGFVALAYAAREPMTIVLLCAGLAGLAAAIGRPSPQWLAGVIAGTCAIALLLDSVPPVVSKAETLRVLAGTMLTTSLLLAIVSGLTTLAQTARSRIAVRIAGSWCAASALLVLALQFAR